MSVQWSADLPIVQVRVARPTDKFEEVIRFYRDGLGLKILATFSEHAGYEGIMFGLPGASYHLEFTHHAEGSPCPAPSRDNLLVFYIPDEQAIKRLVVHMEQMGYPPVSPENPYWQAHGTTIEDPDGWRVVLMNTAGI
jgi:catechol 2,3-dioxygenase-like lactoylglutathione lyase family enzyme